MTLARPAVLLLILLFFVYHSWVSSVLITDTVFHRLNCHEGFRLATPLKPSRLEKAMFKCVGKYRYTFPKTRDCIGFCIARKLHMIVESNTTGIQFNRTNLEYALREWFAGDVGATNVIQIVEGFEDCVQEYSNLTLNHLNCHSNGDGKSSQTDLWQCFKRKLPCEVTTTTPESLFRTYHSKFD